MTLTEIMDFINRVEQQFPVDEWKIDDIHAWPLIRQNLAWNNMLPKENFKVTERKSSFLKSLFDTLVSWALASFVDFRSTCKSVQPADIFFLSYTSAKQTDVLNKKYDIFCDPLISLLKQSHQKSLVWEYAQDNEYNIPRYTPSFFVQPRLFLNRLKYKILGLKKINDFTISLKNYAEFLEFVKQNQVSNFRYLDINLLSQDIGYLRYLANFYKNYLLKINPSHAFTADNGFHELALNLACRELGITSVSIQHGVQGDLHSDYGRWENVPKDGFELLPRIFWCWDSESAVAINQWAKACSSAHVAIVGGNPWLEMWIKKEDRLVSVYDQKIKKLKIKTAHAKNILVTLQTPEKIYSKGEIIPKFVLEAIAGSPREWFWWIRLHPIGMKCRKQINQLLRQYRIFNMDIDHATDLPLPALLRHMDVHVTHSSSVVLDAQRFGVPSVVWSESGESLFLKLFLSGMTKSAYNSIQLIDSIQSQLAHRKTIQTTPIDSSAAMKQVLSTQAFSRTAYPEIFDYSELISTNKI